MQAQLLFVLQMDCEIVPTGVSGSRGARSMTVKDLVVRNTLAHGAQNSVHEIFAMTYHVVP
jgi:hypothetical protein